MTANGVNFAVFEINESEVGSEIQIALKQKSGISTVPNLFIKGESLGGCTDVKALEHSGKLFTILSPYVGKDVAKNPALHSLSFLWFPETVNAHVTRMVAMFTFIFALLCVIMWHKSETRYAVLALAMDCVARFVYGSSHSPLGMLATAYLSKIPPRFTAGPPKQFAALCACFFSVFGCGLYLGGEKVGGAVVICILAFFAFIEAFFDFCFGCYFFGLAVSWKWISPSIYRPYLNMVEDKKWTYNYMNEKRTFPVATAEHYLLPGQKEPTPVDLIRKDRLELEYKLGDVSVIRHLRVEFFGMPMAIAALAYCFELTDETAPPKANFGTGWAYQILAIVSVIIYGLMFLVYASKLVFYPKKVCKEWHHPVFGNYFSTLTISIVLYGLLLLARDVSGGGVLIWIGSIGQMLITVLKVSDIVFTRISDEFLNPGLMMAPVGNFISALAFARYDSLGGPDRHGDMNYLFISRLWFGVASLFAIVLFTITFKRSLHDHHSDDRIRPTLWVWLATSSVAGPAYWAVSGFNGDVGLSVTFQSLWCISLFFFVVNANGWIRNFYNYPKDMSIWIMPFSVAAFTMSTIFYFYTVVDQLFTVLSIMTQVFTCILAVMCGLYTFMWLFDNTLFTPRAKWGPASFMKLTHEAFRFAVPKYAAMLNGLEVASPAAVEKFVEEFSHFIAAFDAHSQHEDHVIFPAARRFFPALNPSMDSEHEQLHADLGKLVELVRNFQSKKGNEQVAAGKEMIASLKKTFAPWGDYALDHMRNEEATVTNVVRKYMPLEYQMELTKRVFELTSGEEWRKVLPWVVNNLPVSAWKVRYVKTFIWAAPTRAQEIGLMLYSGVDSVTWVFLAREIPEIVPRGLCCSQRIY